MPMSRHVSVTSSSASLVFFVIAVVAVDVFLLPGGCSAARQFSTVAISNTENATLICALVRPKGSPDDVVPGGAKLQCTSFPGGEVVSYPSADIPYNAIAAGTDFLCGLMAPTGGHAAMRWWSFSEEALANRSRPVGRRLYWGPSLRALSAGGRHVCGLSDDHDPTCWEWPGLTLPKGLDFSRIALGRDFLCGVVKGSGGGEGNMSCYGGGIATPTFSAGAAIKAVAAGHRHACAVDGEGGLSCWGEGYPAEMTAGELPGEMKAMALGRNTTCILAGDDTVRCWGVEVPAEYRRASFVSIEADGDVVCGVLTANFAVVCWGGNAGGGRLVYNDTMPGACSTKGNCSSACGFIPGSGPLCENGGGEGGEELVVCQPCKMKLNASRLAVGNGFSKNAAAPDGDGDGKARKKKAVQVAVAVVGVGVAVLVVAGLVFYLTVVKRRRCGKTHAATTIKLGESSSLGFCRDMEAAAVVMPAPEESSPLPMLPLARPLGCEEFTVKELSRLTNGFAEERKIGSGSFGSVYRAKLPDGREVAIKRAERASSGVSRRRRRRRYDAERAFRAELRLLSRVNHRNLVQLLGFCEERGERILVFEFMPHGALHDHLHLAGDRDVDGAYSPLFASWEARLRVALDAARGVEYLHCYAVPPIIHRDIKPSNILLDGEWTAKVSDFGFSLANTSSAQCATSTSSTTAGTVGYIDPEYYRLQELTQRSDVYSFGVVLLELVTGRKAIHRNGDGDGDGSPRNVIEFAVPAVEAGNIGKILDGRVPPPRGHETEAVSRVAKIAAECVRPRGRARPVMSEVVAELEWAVTLCEESLLRRSGHQHSSRHAGSDVSRSDSDERSPFQSREFAAGVGSGRLLGGHGRSNSAM